MYKLSIFIVILLCETVCTTVLKAQFLCGKSSKDSLLVYIQRLKEEQPKCEVVDTPWEGGVYVKNYKLFGISGEYKFIVSGDSLSMYYWRSDTNSSVPFQVNTYLQIYLQLVKNYGTPSSQKNNRAFYILSLGGQ